MKKTRGFVFFVVFALIAALSYTTFFGISWWYGDTEHVIIKSADSIRWGIDIRGGVDATFRPADGIDADDYQMDAAVSVIKTRLVANNITDYEVYVDYEKDRIIVRFPWKSGETDFDPEAAVNELGETALLTFREGNEQDENGAPTGKTASHIILEGSDVERAEMGMSTESELPIVQLTLKSSGKEKFSTATGEMIGKTISIWMDDTMISAPTVNDQITGGIAMIEGSNFTVASAIDLANKINSGALPFKLERESFNTISPTLGQNAKDAMILAGIFAFIAICIMMILIYRLPGFVACIALAAQVTGMVALVSGYFPQFASFTLTLPGIAGIILSTGMAVDANVITNARIREEIRSGKSLDASLRSGYDRAFSAIFDGNITVIIVALILMAAFGPADSIVSIAFSWIFKWFGTSAEGLVYSFGYTLFTGVLMNFIMGVGASKLMLMGISRFKPLRKAWLYGGVK